MHLLAGVRVLAPFVKLEGRFSKTSLAARSGEALGVVGSHDGDVGLDGVGHDVDAGGSGQAAQGGHAVVGVDDSHVGEQRVVGERPLDAGLLVGDDGERRALEPVPEEVGTATK